ncbi:HIG1 domain family member 1A, mitochondrial [Orussus abietinus]|uniref:HIG1 domain family member 1A, mitochondrial n=1 Tax=Orussus abietinus TaxID=222816 RepID=UPI00062653B8|nr:HIG1 domain family member 1A, mitochondrial [Orussus abietinus]XP_012282028.1 HIG1 domain family member 1A, mitochondrial [Orussus abietinus]XP_012282029.1 HIG1 domain family member 1A, mitochondrial [Orussus abietinus]XP_012282030.1 HIG1 domain family member 1A, mitochondrial [Orussus abietinus]
MDKRTVEVLDETSGSKFIRKSKESPFLVVGLAGLVAACAYGAYSFKTKKVSTSTFLMQLRVTAQGLVIASLTVGVAWQMVQKYVLHDEKKE